jgi:phage FluMu gp28-like protein
MSAAEDIYAGAAESPQTLLSYQVRVDARIIETANDNQTALPLILAIEKSRRIGITWGVGFAAVITAAGARGEGGQNVYYMGYNLEMARDFIETCARWARAVDTAASDIGEFVFEDEDKDVKAFRIDFASGFSIIALPSSPRVLRGRQGLVIIDEAAFHDDLEELMKAVVALTMWGGRVILISTHNGEDNPFNDLINEIRSGRRSGEVMRITLEDALKEGLYRRISEVQGLEYSPEAEAAWEADLRRAYGSAAAEELDVIPARGSGSYLSLALIENCADKSIPVIRWEQPASFVDLAPHLRQSATRLFCEQQLLPHLLAANPDRPSVFAQDFAMVSDLSVLIPAQIAEDLTRIPLFQLEMRSIPYDCQRQILFYVVDRLPRRGKGALDATGNGAPLAQEARQRYGTEFVAEVKFSTEWYREQMPAVKAAFEDRTIRVAKDRDTFDDLRLFKLIDGVAKMPSSRTGNAGSLRHGDAGIAYALMIFASRQEVRPVEGFPTGEQRASAGAWGDGRRATVNRSTGWGTIGGGLGGMRGF